MEIIINILLVIVVLGILVLIHETGHFLAAKISNIKVDEFAIGFGPKLISKKIGETEYMLKLLPLGGYVKIMGEGDEYFEEKDLVGKEIDPDKTKRDPRSYKNKPILVRFFVMVAGVLMNFILASALFYIVLASVDNTLNYPSEMAGYDPYFGTKKTVVLGDFSYSELVEDGRAELSGMPSSGIITKIDSKPISLSTEFLEYIVDKSGQNVEVEVCNEEKSVCDVYDVAISDDGKFGIMYSPNYYIEIKYEGVTKIFGGFAHSLNQISLLGYYIPSLFKQASQTGDYKQVAVGSFSSPIALYFVVDAFKDVGWIAMLDLIAGLSFSLALVNIMPIPALDGGRVLLLFFEAVKGKPLNPKLEAVLIQVSFYILMVLMVVIVLKDVIFLDFIKEMF